MSTKAPLIRNRSYLFSEMFPHEDKLDIALKVHEQHEADSLLYAEVKKNWEGKARALKGQLTRLDNECRAIAREIKKQKAELEEAKKRVAVWQGISIAPDASSCFDPVQIPSLSDPVEILPRGDEIESLRFPGIYTVWEDCTLDQPCLYVGKSVQINRRIPHTNAKPGEFVRCVAIPEHEHLFYECAYIAALRPYRNRARPS